MKLYATTTSERASKGQGGDYLDIEVKGENKENILELHIKEVNDEYVIDGYAISQREDKKRSEYYIKYVLEKGKSQKGENKLCSKCRLNPKYNEIYKDIGCEHNF